MRLPAADVPRIRDVLAAIEPAEWRRLHEGLKRWWQPFVWEQQARGTAYNTTIAALKRRLVQRQAGLASRRRQ